MAQITQSFHNTVDTQARAYQYYNGEGWINYNPFITLTDRSLTYQFFPHFHTYVPDLIQRLNNGGFSELQDSDTLYLPQPNPLPGQPLTVIPDSTRSEEHTSELQSLR